MKHPVVKEDHYSKRALRNKMASTIARELEYNFMPLFIVVPKLVLLDNTAEFQNFSIKTWLGKYQVTIPTIAPGYPASNGVIERLVE